MMDVNLWRQRKHGRAANKQGACSPTCCEESPRALGQKVSLGDQQARFEVCREASVELHDIEVGHLQQHSNAVSTLLECQLNGAHSPYASFVAILHGVLSGLQLWISLDGVEFFRDVHICKFVQKQAESTSMMDVNLWRQRKHGRAANKQGACSPTCCEESPRALGQKVSLGDQQARFEVCREASVELHDIEVGHLQQHSNAVSTLLECQLNGAHSPYASFVAILHGVLSGLQLWISLDGVSFFAMSTSASLYRSRQRQLP